MTGQSWSERLLGGFRRTSERLGENLAGLTGKARLGDDDHVSYTHVKLPTILLQ